MLTILWSVSSVGGQVAGNTYYVDQKSPDAVDSNPGTPALPLRTISRATAIAQAGDRIVVKQGVYRESIRFSHPGEADAPIVLEAEIPELPPILDGTDRFEHWIGPDSRGVFSHATEGLPRTLYQDGRKLAIAMKPDALDPEDPYLHDAWYAIESDAVVPPGSLEEAQMVAGGIEYLYLHEDFATHQGEPASHDYWVGAMLYHYNHYQNRTLLREIVAYDETLNRITVALPQNERWARFLVPDPRKDYYAIANHVGVLDAPGEFVSAGEQVFVRPLEDVLGVMEGSVRPHAIMLTSPHIVIDGLEMRRYTDTAIYDDYRNQADGFRLLNSRIHHNGGSGLYVRNSLGAHIENCEFAYNDQNGISFGADTGNIRIFDTYVHHNNDNGIWLGSGGPDVYYCRDVIIRGCRVVFQGSAQSHPDNIQFHQVADLILENNYLEQEGHQNMWCQASGRITFRNNVFVNGRLGLCQMSPAYLYNNVFDQSGIRFDAHQGTLGAWRLTVDDIDRVWAAWSRLRDDIRGEITSFPLHLLWDPAPAFVAEIRAWPEDRVIEEDTLKAEIVAHINAVIADLDFFRNHASVYAALNPDDAAKHVVDAIVQRQLMDRDGNLRANLTQGETEEILGMNRVMIEELLLSKRVLANVHNYRTRHVEILNNVFIESSISRPPVELELDPYFGIDFNYFNMVNDYLLSSWEDFVGTGEHSIVSRYAEHLPNEFADPANHDFHLLPSSRLIDAGTDVGLPYDSAQADIGRYEHEGIPAPRLVDIHGAPNAIELGWTHIMPATIETYTVWRADAEDHFASFTAIASGITDLAYRDTNLANGVMHAYRITAQRQGEESGPSNVLKGMGTLIWRQDDFEDAVTWGTEGIFYADPDLVNGITWELTESSQIHMDLPDMLLPECNTYWLRPGLNDQTPAFVLSTKAILPDFVLEFDDLQAYVVEDQGALVLYQDFDNHYRIQISRYDFKVIRVMDGEVTVVGEEAALAMQHPLSGAHFRIEVLRTEGGIRFACTKSDWIKYNEDPIAYDAEVYQTVIEDQDADAVGRFENGKIGFYQLLLGTYNVARYDNVRVTTVRDEAGCRVDGDGDGDVDGMDLFFLSGFTECDEEAMWPAITREFGK